MDGNVKKAPQKSDKLSEPLSKTYLKEISSIILISRNKAEVAVNSTLVMLYWNIGKLIKEQILAGNKPAYGKSVIENISKELVGQFGRSYSTRNLFHMVKFYEVFGDEQILNTLCTKLSWSHFRKLITLKDPLKIEFYGTLALNERWSVRELSGRIDSMMYERTAISKMPDVTITKDLELLRDKKAMSMDLVLRDPYVLDFLELKDHVRENDLETAIMQELEKFILEMGRDFTFVGRQVRLVFDNRDYYIDLLLYHRKLRCLVVVELKLGAFKPEYKGQVELYLNYLEKYETNEGENPPIGIILCSSKEAEVVELMKLDEARIHVAEFIVKILSEKFPQAVENAKILIEQRKGVLEDEKQ